MRIELRGLTKRYGDTLALDGVTLQFEPGQVHALVGENGAGKSTCLGMLGGHKKPTSGQMLIDGDPVAFDSPRGAGSHGIVSIHQELTIIPELTALQNVFLGQEYRSLGTFSRERAMRDRFRALTTQLGVDIPAARNAGALSVSDQQMLEIMRALVAAPSAVLFDEPTAALGPRERERLYEIIRSLRDAGAVLAFVSHNLDEVLSLADVVSVFRDGRLIRTAPASEWTRRTLTHTMVGRDIEEERVAPEVDDDAPLMLRAVDFGPAGGPTNSFDLRRGEIVGLAGLVGSGRSRLLRSLAGAERATAGFLEIDGRRVPPPPNVRAARRAGIAMLTEDRKHAGILPEASARSNILLGNLASTARAGFLRERHDRQRAKDAAAMVGFASSRLDDAVQQLSGGNQQKTLLARLLLLQPGVVLVDEPARGVDIGAKEEIFASIRRLAAQGSAVVMVSSEFEELQANCSRVLVVWHGRIVGELRGEEITRQNMVTRSFGPEESAA